MIPRALLTALAAAALYAVVLVASGSAELAPTPDGAASGALTTAAVEDPIAVPSTDELLAEELAPVATPTPPHSRADAGTGRASSRDHRSGARGHRTRPALRRS